MGLITRRCEGLEKDDTFVDLTLTRLGPQDKIGKLAAELFFKNSASGVPQLRGTANEKNISFNLYHTDDLAKAREQGIQL